MDATELRARQAPLKDRYRAEPDTAYVRVAATGDFDARGTLGVDRSVGVGMRDIVVTITLDTDAADADLERLARATERYCVVGQSLAVPPRIVVARG